MNFVIFKYDDHDDDDVDDDDDEDENGNDDDDCKYDDGPNGICTCHFFKFVHPITFKNTNKLQ